MSYEDSQKLVTLPNVTTKKQEEMKPNTKELSEREAAILRYGIAYNITSPAKLYALACDGSQDPAVATRWMQSKKVQDFLTRERAFWDESRRKEKAKIESEALAREAASRGKAASSKDLGPIDYADPKNQLRKLNELINTARDADEQLDALKIMIATTAKNAEADESTHRKQVRAYLPLNCHDCPLYQRARQELEEREQNN